jgi:hypothetical protein
VVFKWTLQTGGFGDESRKTPQRRILFGRSPAPEGWLDDGIR